MQQVQAAWPFPGQVTMNPKIAVVGLGYVGAPLAIQLAKHFDVIGYDINTSRVNELSCGADSTHELDISELSSTRCKFTWQLKDIAACDFYIVTVPTPVTDANVPDLRPVELATNAIASVLKAGDTVVYESTVYPGVTEEVCVPILERVSGLNWLKDFAVGYSPERINPGDKVNTLTTTTKIVSGDSSTSLDLIDSVYSAITTTYRAATIKVAEAAKVIENTQRDVNIALMNELSQIFNRLGIDTHDVIDAAASKWNFRDYRPGLVGGHCISVDPFYLTHRAAIAGYNADLILSSRHINDEMVDHIVRETARLVIASPIKDKGSVTIIGCTFKENVPDIRNSKVFKIADALISYGVKVQLYDPWADIAEVQHEYGMSHVVIPQLLDPSDTIILAVPHKVVIDQGWAGIEAMTNGGPFVIIDVKAALNRSTKPANAILWRP